MFAASLPFLLVLACARGPAAPPPEAQAVAAPVVEAPPPVTPQWRGDDCEQDADCAWDDLCQPLRCVAVERASREACATRQAFTGSCGCNEGMCTLRPDDPGLVRSPETGCASDADCAVDIPSGSCRLHGDTHIGPIRREGPVCTCDADRRCDFVWSGPVPCTTSADCSFVREPRLRPVPSSVVPRSVPVEFKPCVDGETDSRCITGYCEVVGFGC